MVFVADFLGSIGVEQQAINKIMAMLDESAGALDGVKPGEVRSGSFGGSEQASALDADTRLAHQHVVRAIDEMVAGMKGFRSNVDKWQSDLSFTDDDQGDSYRRLQGTTDSSSLLAAIEGSSACTTSSTFQDEPGAPTCDVDAVTGGGQG